MTDGVPRVVNLAESAIFDLDTGSMLDQIQTAAEVALNNPRRYPSLYGFLVQGAEGADGAAWVKMAEEPMHGDVMPQEAKERADCYQRLAEMVWGKLDSFQLAARYLWARWNRHASLVIGAVPAAVVVMLLFPPALWIVGLPIAVLGGLAAPFAKDMSSVLRSLRRNV